MSDKRFQKKLDRIKKRGERYKAQKELEDAYADFVPSSKKHKVSNIMLVIIVIAITLYTAANFLLLYTSGVAMDSTLTTCFYTFWGSELIALAGIRVSKVVKSNSDNDACG